MKILPHNERKVTSGPMGLEQEKDNILFFLFPFYEIFNYSFPASLPNSYIFGREGNAGGGGENGSAMRCDK